MNFRNYLMEQRPFPAKGLGAWLERRRAAKEIRKNPDYTKSIDFKLLDSNTRERVVKQAAKPSLLSRITGRTDKQAANVAQAQRNDRRSGAIYRNAAKAQAKRASQTADIPSEWSSDSKTSMRANISGIRDAVRRWDHTQITAMSQKMKGKTGPVAHATKLEVKARATRQKREEAKKARTSLQ